MGAYSNRRSGAVQAEAKHRWQRPLQGLWRLRSEAGRFIGLGLFSYGLGIALSALLREVLQFSAQSAVALTLATLFAVNFWLSRQYVFRAQGHAGRQFLLFVATASAMRMAEYAMFYAMLQYLQLHYLLALTVAMAISSCLKFLIYRTLVFRRHVRTARLPDPSVRP